MARYRLLFTLVGLSAVAGCSGEPTVVEIRNPQAVVPATAAPPPPPAEMSPPEQEEEPAPPTPAKVAANLESPAPAKPAKGKNKKQKKKNEPEITPASYNLAAVETSAVKKIISTIKDSVDLGPTLVVWLLDRTTSAREIVRDATSATQDFYNSPEVAAWSAAANKPLLTSIVAFDDTAEFLLDPPSPDGKKITAALENLSSSTASREMTFAAIKQALEKYLPLRTKERRDVIFVVVTDEAGDDGQVVDELIEPFRRHAIPVYAIGLPAPWGQSNPFAVNPKAIPASKDELLPTVGPESLLSERVDIESTARSGNRASSDLVDSGFGPFALERLCRASHGQFLALRGEAGQRGVNARSWPPGTELRFDQRVVGKYAPDYVSAAEYEKSLLDNKAKAVLVEAAKVAKYKMEGQPTLRFPKDADAKMAKKMSDAQQFAARPNLPPIDHLHDLLIKGEADRAKLTSPRWQAEFDLAAGRVFATKARLDGYNSMIAVLKRGKTFEKADSKVWNLDPADRYQTESTIKKLADKAKLYLQRVTRDHAGTPWAKIADEELKQDLGWHWRRVALELFYRPRIEPPLSMPHSLPTALRQDSAKLY